MRWGLYGLLLVAVVYGDASADKRSKKAGLHRKVIDAGDRWFCLAYQFGATSDAGCVRDEDVCDAVVDELRADNPYADISGCNEQPKAAVFTFFNVLEDRYEYRALPTFAVCKLMRRAVASSPEDARQVSSCHAVGKIKPPKEPKRKPRTGPSGYCVTVRDADTERQQCKSSVYDCEEVATGAAAGGATIVEKCTFYGYAD